MILVDLIFIRIRITENLQLLRELNLYLVGKTHLSRSPQPPPHPTSPLSETGRHKWKLSRHIFKGIVHNFFIFGQIFFLSSNGVWYSWFWPEGPKNAPNSIFWGFKFAPRDLDSQRHMGPRLAAQGTLTRSAGDLDSQRHQGPMALRGKIEKLWTIPLSCEIFSTHQWSSTAVKIKTLSLNSTTDQIYTIFCHLCWTISKNLFQTHKKGGDCSV